MTKVVPFYAGLLQYILGNLVFKNCLNEPFKSTIKGRIIRLLVFRTVLRLYCRLFSKYLIVENIVEDMAEGLKIRLGVEPGVESLFSSSILLSIREIVWDIGVIEDSTKAQFL